MRIVHLYKDYFPPVRGGIEQTIEAMAVAQARLGHDVTVLVSASGGRRRVEEVLDGVRVIRVAEWGRLLSSPLCPGFPAALARLTAEVWHLHVPNPLGEASWLMRKPSGALVVTYHSDVVRQKALLPVYGRLLHALLARADVILPTSDAYVGHSPFLRRWRSKCRVVPLGVDVDRFAPAAERRERSAALRAAAGRPLILFVGRLRYYKGLGVLLDAMQAVDAALVLVGDGPLRADLEARRARLGLGDRVRITGDVGDEELLDWLAAADVGVLPSIHPSEALGIALIEYLASGIPAVSTELGTGTSFVNQDGVTGVVVPPGDPAALAAALQRLVADPALRRRLGEAGARRAHAVFSRDAMVEGTLAAYRAALAGRAATLHSPRAVP